MKLIRQKYNYHVSLDTVEEFEKIIASDSWVFTKNEKNKFFSKILYKFWDTITKTKKNLSSTKVSNSEIFVVLMGTDFSKCLPFFLSKANKYLYLFDAWPDKHQQIINFINRFKVKYLFLTSSQAVKIIQSKVPNTKCYWIPEGINPSKYQHKIYREKNIDVLALGRKYDVYHNKIINYLQNNKYTYLYEKKEGQLVFPTQKDFIEGLAQTKISICIPSNITHPKRSGNIETMTIRYLQSMSSKCLILGHAPEEMITLFGYNPVIEIDKKNPEGQIIDILENYSTYQPLIEKNYNCVLKNHTWQNRWNSLKQILNEK